MERVNGGMKYLRHTGNYEATSKAQAQFDLDHELA